MGEDDVAPDLPSLRAQGPVDLDGNALRPSDEGVARGQVREGFEDRLADVGELVAQLGEGILGELPRVPEAMKGPDEGRVHGELEIHVSDGLPEEPRQGLHLLMGDEVRGLRAHSGRKREALLPAHGFPLLQASVDPDRRPDQDVVQERVAGIQGEVGEAREVDDPSGPYADRFDDVEPTRGRPREDVRHPRVEAHREEGGDPGGAERVPPLDLLEDSVGFPGTERPAGGQIDVMDARGDAGPHDRYVMPRPGAVGDDVAPAQGLREPIDIVRASLHHVDRLRVALLLGSRQRATVVVEEPDRFHAGVLVERASDGPSVAADAEDRRPHGPSVHLSGYRLFAPISYTDIRSRAHEDDPERVRETNAREHRNIRSNLVLRGNGQSRFIAQPQLRIDVGFTIVARDVTSKLTPLGSAEGPGFPSQKYRHKAPCWVAGI